MKLSDDAWLFLLEGLGEPGERLPDGARHANAIVELRERGFLGWGPERDGRRYLEATPAGKAHFLGRSAKERKAARAK